MSEEKPKRRLITFADIAARSAEPDPAAASGGRPPDTIPAAEPPERATYARLVSLSKRPEDFSASPAGPGGCAPALATPVSGIPVLPIPITPTPVAKEAESGIPELGTPQAEAALLRFRRHIREALTAKDGHSLGEQAVFEALWANSEPYSADCRTVAIGYRMLSEACRLSVNNCKANLRALVQKLAIGELAGHSYTHSKTYLVYNGPAILRRRKAAGLTHYIKTRGVIFVDPETGIPKSGVPDSVEGVPGSGTPETG